MEAREFSGRTVEEALTTATVELGVTSDKLNYEVVEKGSSGFLGLGSKEAVIRVTLKGDEPEEAAVETASTETVSSEPNTAEEDASSWASVEQQVQERAAAETRPQREWHDYSNEPPLDEAEVKAHAEEFLKPVFDAMQLEVDLDMDYNNDTHTLSIDMNGPEMGIIIGKRGQTLDSLQYLTNLAINRKLDSYVRVKMDTEDYRRRRKVTLENLAKNVAYKVKRTRRSVSLEPMNPYERRVIHYALQHDSYVTTYSEGDEPYRHVVVALRSI